jgi:hypothetical protein
MVFMCVFLLVLRLSRTVAPNEERLGTGRIIWRLLAFDMAEVPVVNRVHLADLFGLRVDDFGG